MGAHLMGTLISNSCVGWREWFRGGFMWFIKALECTFYGVRALTSIWWGGSNQFYRYSLPTFFLCWWRILIFGTEGFSGFNVTLDNHVINIRLVLNVKDKQLNDVQCQTTGIYYHWWWMHFYPRPVLAFGYCRCLRLSVCASVCAVITCLSAR